MPSVSLQTYRHHLSFPARALERTRAGAPSILHRAGISRTTRAFHAATRERYRGRLNGMRFNMPGSRQPPRIPPDTPYGRPVLPPVATASCPPPACLPRRLLRSLLIPPNTTCRRATRLRADLHLPGRLRRACALVDGAAGILAPVFARDVTTRAANKNHLINFATPGGLHRRLMSASPITPSALSRDAGAAGVLRTF